MDTTGRRIKRLRLKRESRNLNFLSAPALPQRFFNSTNMVRAIPRKIS